MSIFGHTPEQRPVHSSVEMTNADLTTWHLPSGLKCSYKSPLIRGSFTWHYWYYNNYAISNDFIAACDSEGFVCFCMCNGHKVHMGENGNL